MYNVRKGLKGEKVVTGSVEKTEINKRNVIYK